MTQPDRTWWERNRVWVILVGLAPIVLGVVLGFAALIVILVLGIIKSSDVYQVAIARAQKSEHVQAALGTPIEEGFFVTGSIRINGEAGTADLAIPLSGPKGSATLFAVAHKRDGRWIFSRLEVVMAGGGNPIDLKDD